MEKRGVISRDTPPEDSSSVDYRNKLAQELPAASVDVDKIEAGLTKRLADRVCSQVSTRKGPSS